MAWLELAEMTTVEFAAAKPRLALLPVGATEQHGPNMRTSTDTVIAHRIAQRLAEAVGPEAVVLPPLPYGGGYLVYKEGQAAMRFIEERYGPERIRDIMQKLKFHRNFDRAFDISMGTTVVKFDEDFQSWLKKTYWPSGETAAAMLMFERSRR